MKDYLKYDDTQIFKYDNLILASIYTVGHILIAMTCNRIITGASFDVAAADAFIEPIINGFWFYFLLVFLKKIIIQKIDSYNIGFLNSSSIGIYLAVMHSGITNAPLAGKLGIDEVLTGKRNNLIRDFLPQKTVTQKEFQNV